MSFQGNMPIIQVDRNIGVYAVSAFNYIMQTTFFYFERFLKKLTNDQCSSVNKGSIYCIKHVYIQPFTTEVI